MSCRWSADEIREKRDELDREIDDLQHTARAGRAPLGVASRLEALENQREELTDLLESKRT